MAPQMRGLLQRQLYRDLGIGMALSLAAGFMWHFGYSEPKRKRYAEFYKNYDAEAKAKEIEATVAKYEAERED